MNWLRYMLSTANQEALGFALMFYGGLTLVAVVLLAVVLFFVLR